MTDQQPNPRPSSFPAWAMIRLPAGRIIETKEETFATAVAYLVAEKRDHYLGDITHIEHGLVRDLYERRRLKHPSKIVKANVVHVFPYTTDPKDKTEIEDRIFEIAAKIARHSGSTEDLRRLYAIRRDKNGEPATILDAVTEEIIKKQEQEVAALREWLSKSNPQLQQQRNTLPRSNGFVRVFNAGDAAMIADRLADHLIVYLQRDPNMPRRTRHEWELIVGDLRSDFAEQLFNLARR
jgi:hypothetical protein